MLRIARHEGKRPRAECAQASTNRRVIRRSLACCAAGGSLKRDVTSLIMAAAPLFREI
jgi:hypothetical protein